MAALEPLSFASRVRDVVLGDGPRALIRRQRAPSGVAVVAHNLQVRGERMVELAALLDGDVAVVAGGKV